MGSRLARRARGQLWAVRCRCTLGGCHKLCASRSVALWFHRVPYGFTFVAHAGPEPGQKQPHSARCYSNTRSPSPPPGVVPHGWRLCSRQRCRLILIRGVYRVLAAERELKKRGGLVAVLVTGLQQTRACYFSRTRAHNLMKPRGRKRKRARATRRVVVRIGRRRSVLGERKCTYILDRKSQESMLSDGWPQNVKMEN